MRFGALSGSDMRLQIDLPGEGWITVEAETPYARENSGSRCGSLSSATATQGASSGPPSDCSSNDRAAPGADGRSASREMSG
jgi:hypothetical protein